MNRTKIEWVKNPDGTQGYTWNPITGCLNHVNGMCKGGNFPCYAYRLAYGRLKNVYIANDNIANPIATGTRDEIEEEAMEKLADPFYPRFWEDRLYEPVNKMRRWGRQSKVLHTQEPKGIFVCDMSDLFGIGIPEEWTKRVLDRFQYAPQHRFYLLTKQPQNLIKWSPFPENCWVGVTVCNDSMMKPALNALMDIEAKTTFISFEPLLGRINAGSIVASQSYRWLDWLIIGAQTRPYKPPKIEWIKEIVEAADKAGIPVFLKNNLKPLIESYAAQRGIWISMRQEIPDTGLKNG